MRDIPTASFLMWSFMVSHTLTMNWWGTTKIRMSAPFTDSAKSGTANWWRERKNTLNHRVTGRHQRSVRLLTRHQRLFWSSPHWGAACDRANISHFHGLCWWFLWAYGRSPSLQTPTCSLWCWTCHTWLRWHPQSWQWQSPCGDRGAQSSRLCLWCVNTWNSNNLIPSRDVGGGRDRKVVICLVLSKTCWLPDT